MKNSNHIINRIVVRAEGIDVDNVFGWRSHLSAYLTHDLPRQLEQSLDECCSEDNVLTIDKLNIKVDVRPWENMESMEQDILISIQKELLGFKHQKTPADRLTDQNAATRKIGLQMLEAWMYYLENGFYPWYWSQGVSDAQFEEQITEYHDQILSKLRVVLNSPTVAKRFVLTTSKRKMQSLFQVLLGSQIFNQLLKRDRRRKADDSFTYQMLNVALVRLIVREQELNELELENDFQNLWTLTGEEYSQHESWLENLIQEITQRSITERQRDRSKERQECSGEPDSSDRLAPLQAQHTAEKSEIKAESTEPSNGKEIWVLNGGVILIHPFLKPLFTALNIIDDEQKIVYPAKALTALHFVLYEDAPYSDDQMVLPKILCGLNFNEPVLVANELVDSEKQECKEMLQSVIWHWDALKKTSIEGLRNTFLFRKAKLLQTNAGWKLIIEPQTEDILLSRLPWNISIIKHPWMNGMIATEWN